MTATPPGPAIRDAATIILLRGPAEAPSVLMGQRGARAAFMPMKFVFPGGAVDPGDGDIPLARPLRDPCAGRLAADSTPAPVALAAAAIRELWEESGQALAVREDWPDAPRGWRGFAAAGFRPDASALRFVFRAVTPPGRPRRFDARFFAADAARLATDPDDFDRAEDELAHLQWIPLADLRRFDLPFITRIVLAELAAGAGRDTAPDTVPFYRGADEGQRFDALGLR